jgi:carbonic anhydrase/acetyltransferase-like protein (isoleucine patch superfamily)
MPIYMLDGEKPDLPEDGLYWIAPDAHVIGRVKLGQLPVGQWRYLAPGEVF